MADRRTRIAHVAQVALRGEQLGYSAVDANSG
jgi:hypothetical protein